MSEKREQIEQALLDFKAGKDPEGNFALIYRLCFHEINWKFRKSRAFDEDKCFEITQTVFSNVYKGMSRFNRESSFHTWLMVIAKNVFLDALRERNKTRRNISLDQPVVDGDGEERAMDFPDLSPEANPLYNLINKENRERLEKAVMNLPERMRDYAILRIYEGLSYEEIAVLLKVSVNTVKPQLHNAIKRIKAELGSDIGE